MSVPELSELEASAADFGRPPSYSTLTTLGLALLSVAASLLHGGLGATDYTLTRAGGVAYMLLSGLLLVYGILLLIRYAEARDAMSDPLPRTAMYDTAHERGNFRAGVGLHAASVAFAVVFAALHQVLVWHALAVLLSGYAVWLLIRLRPPHASSSRQ